MDATDIGASEILADMVQRRIEEELSKEAQDPATAGVVGDPVPAEMVQQGAQQMVPPPGAASGGDPAQQDPMLDTMNQIGMLIEQIAGELITLMTRLADSNDRVEKQLIMLSGMTAGEEAAMAANPMPEPQPAAPAGPAPQKMASGELISARGRDGVMSSGGGAEMGDFRQTLQRASSLAQAVAIVQRNG